MSPKLRFVGVAIQGALGFKKAHPEIDAFEAGASPTRAIPKLELGNEGNISKFVPPHVVQAFAAKRQS